MRFQAVGILEHETRKFIRCLIDLLVGVSMIERYINLIFPIHAAITNFRYKSSSRYKEKQTVYFSVILIVYIYIARNILVIILRKLDKFCGNS